MENEDLTFPLSGGVLAGRPTAAQVLSLAFINGLAAWFVHYACVNDVPLDASVVEPFRPLYLGASTSPIALLSNRLRALGNRLSVGARVISHSPPHLPTLEWVVTWIRR